MDLGLKGRVVLVTGSSRGIGRAVAELYSQEGARVVITYRERHEAAEAVARSIHASGGEAIVVQFQLESRESIEAAIAAVQTRWGGIEVLVNNAVATKMLARDSDITEWQALVRTNVEGAYQTIQAVVGGMRSSRWGRIVNVSSALAVDGMPNLSWYTTAKSALHGMTRTLSKELGPFGILVNAVMPGLTRTMEQPVHISQRHLDKLAAELAIRRLPAPKEVARSIIFLGSASNSIITGEIVRVSGG